MNEEAKNEEVVPPDAPEKEVMLTTPSGSVPDVSSDSAPSPALPPDPGPGSHSNLDPHQDPAKTPVPDNGPEATDAAKDEGSGDTTDLKDIPETPVTIMKPPGGECHDIFGAEFKGTPCHHRVLKPPGGGTSDIFGAPDPVSQNRRVRNNLQSSVFGPPTNGELTPVRNKPGNDSYARLFGPSDSRPASATKNRLKSNIILSTDDSKEGLKAQMDSQSTIDGSVSSKGLNNLLGMSPLILIPASMPRRNPVTGDGMYVKEFRRSARKRDGNPVTGEGYNNSEKPGSAAAANNPPSDAPTNGTSSHSAPPQRTRIPPGGYSSGLW